MTTLVISCASIQGATLLAMAARRRGWEVRYGLPEPSELLGEMALYTSTLDAPVYVERYDLALIEPPLDLLARVPMSLLLRRVDYATWGELGRVSQPLFIKPADPLNKVFDAGVYRERGQIRASAPAETAVLVSDVVEWTAEYRCFVLNGGIETASPYMMAGRPMAYQAEVVGVPAPVEAVCRRLFDEVELPPAFVADVGLIEDRGWAIVEFNPCWCAGLLSSDFGKVLNVLKRACRRRAELAARDRRWVVDRG